MDAHSSPHHDPTQQRNSAVTDRPLRIAVGAMSLWQPITGIGRYTLNLSEQLARDQRFALRFFYGDQWIDTPRPRHMPGISLIKRIAQKLLRNPRQTAYAIRQSRFNQGLRNWSPDVYHEPNFLPFAFDGPTVISVHDLSYLRHPETHPVERIEQMERMLQKACDRAAHLVTISEYSKQEIVELLGVPAERVTVTYPGVSADFKPRDQAACAAVLSKHQLHYQRFVIAVGTIEPRKNLQLVLRAYQQLPHAVAERHPLIIIGAKGWRNEEFDRLIQPLQQRGVVRLLGFVTDEELATLYSAASMLVYPSLYEGFGLPVAEAMASGLPVVISDRSCLPEIAGDAGSVVGAEDADGLALAIQRLLDDPQTAALQRQRGIARAAQFTWAGCAARTAEVYLQVAAQSTAQRRNGH